VPPQIQGLLPEQIAEELQYKTHLRDILTAYADGYDLPREAVNAAQRRRQMTPRPVPKKNRLMEPVNEYQKLLHTTLKAPPSSLAVNALRGSLVAFEPIEPLQMYGSMAAQTYKSRQSSEAIKLYQNNFEVDRERPFPEFWTCQVNEKIYEQKYTSLFDNLRVEPDWGELDKSWDIKEGDHFDCNGIRWSVCELAYKMGEETGELRPPAIMD